MFSSTDNTHAHMGELCLNERLSCGGHLYLILQILKPILNSRFLYFCSVCLFQEENIEYYNSKAEMDYVSTEYISIYRRCEKHVKVFNI